MADDELPPGFFEPPSDGPLREGEALDNAIARAHAEIDAMMQAAKAAADDGDNGVYTLHEIPEAGRYAVPRLRGWKPLLDIVHDPEADINFSLSDYPSFDTILDEHFGSPYLSDPLDDKYESYTHLRENIAAVRNFLMETYYSNPPAGMSPDKIRTAMEQIAAYLGDGLYNNWLLFGAVPNHNPTKPFVSIDRAKQPNGEGAQYLYEKILEMQRHSNWLRPFAPIVAMFGGKSTIDWHLPGVESTPFNMLYEGDLANPAINAVPTEAEIAAAAQRLAQLEARRNYVREANAFTMLAVDLDSIGNHLLYTADNLQAMASLSEPVRREAVEIAKDILRKLKISIGDMNILEGLRLKPKDDLAALGAIKGVVMVYERLLAWGKRIDPSIMQHPSVLAATQSVGQLGYLAKMEALRAAKAAGNTALADKIAGQIARIPPYFANTNQTRFGGLLERIEQGIDTVLNRIQEINGPGAMVGHSPAKELGSYMNATPIAGNSMLLSSDGTSSRNARAAAIMEAEDAAARAQAARIQQQSARAHQSGQGQQRTTTPTRSATGRQAVQQARAAAQSSSSSTNPAMNAQQAARNAQLRRTAWQASHHDDEHDAHAHEQHIDPRILNPKLLQSVRQATNTSGLKTAPVTTGRASFNAMQQHPAQDHHDEDEKKKKDQQLIQPPIPPKGRGGPGM